MTKGSHCGYDWATTHNMLGYRCGYIHIPEGHPWHGRDKDDIDATVHGGLTFSDGIEEYANNLGKPGWWIGFDCAHWNDLPDLELMHPRLGSNELANSVFDLLKANGTVRSEAYVITQCEKLCEQAHLVMRKRRNDLIMAYEKAGLPPEEIPMPEDIPE